MQPVTRVESAERALPGLHHVERGVRGHPEVLRLVGRGADHRPLEDPLRAAVRRVAGAPGTRPAEPGARAAARRCEQGGGERASQGSTLSTAAPPRVATCTAGGVTICVRSIPTI